jgi:hypothetical protein
MTNGQASLPTRDPGIGKRSPKKDADVFMVVTIWTSFEDLFCAPSCVVLMSRRNHNRVKRMMRNFKLSLPAKIFLLGRRAFIQTE